MSEPSARLVRKIHELFDTSADAVVERLRTMIDPFGNEVSERVQAAVIMASGGDWQRFLDQAHLAETDWRDVLVAAGLADGDWPERLDDFLSLAR